MIDPFPIPPPKWLQNAVTPLADRLSLPTLPLHIHEVIFAVALYQFTNTTISPILSSWLCPQTYPNLNKRTRINWDVHVVSLFQSLLVNTLAFYVMFYDEERADMNWVGRIWGYTGAGGLLQAMASGYFIWDLIITAQHVSIFGPGMLAHAVAATTVFMLGFVSTKKNTARGQGIGTDTQHQRPYVNYYGPIFILYELSSPFLNFHWFLDKLQLTGSNYQLFNGIILMSTFFGCRLVWGALNSYWVFQDMWQAFQHGHLIGDSDLGLRLGLNQPAKPLTTENSAPVSDIMRFAGDRHLPLWLPLSYLASNIVLNLLNYYWFGKMIETIRKRFDPPFGTKGLDKDTKAKKEAEEKPEVALARGVYEDGTKTMEVQGREVRSRRRG